MTLLQAAENMERDDNQIRLLCEAVISLERRKTELGISLHETKNINCVMEFGKSIFERRKLLQVKKQSSSFWKGIYQL